MEVVIRYFWLGLIPFGYFLVAILAGILLAYPLDHILNSSVPYHKLVNKCTLLMLLLGIYPVMRYLHWRATDLGFVVKRSLFPAQLFRGFASGVAIMLVVTAALLLLNIRLIDEAALTSLTSILGVAAKALITSLLIGVLEELLFRGLLFGSLKQSAGTLYAIIVSAGFYAALHFLKADKVISSTDITWWSGFQLIEPAFSALLRVEVLDSFLALFCVGIFLACIRVRMPNSLGYCMGLHAGWVFVIKLSKSLTDANAQSEWGFLVGGYDGIIGYGVAAWLLLLILFMGYKDNWLWNKKALSNIS